MPLPRLPGFLGLYLVWEGAVGGGSAGFAVTAAAGRLLTLGALLYKQWSSATETWMLCSAARSLVIGSEQVCHLPRCPTTLSALTDPSPWYPERTEAGALPQQTPSGALFTWCLLEVLGQ